jgi:carboxypeptidase family protein
MREGCEVITLNPTKKDSSEKVLGGTVRRPVRGPWTFVWLGLTVMLCASSALAQARQPLPGTGAPAGPQQPDQRISGSISGTVVDPSGTIVAGARVELAGEGQSTSQEVRSGDDGQFSFADISPGPFHLTITAKGFATQAFSANLAPGETYVVPQIALALAPEITNVRAEVPITVEEEAEVKEEEKQRVLGFLPNFYVSYARKPVPLTSKQKFRLAVRTTADPVSFVLTGITAGLLQAENGFSGYGQGLEGYGKRYGASYGDLVTDTFIGSAMLPSLLKQDPRYFYKGTGGTRQRILYAVAHAVICEGDNGRSQANYSAILGSLASAGIANLYYPAANRGTGLTFEVTAIGIGESAVANLLQEFLIRKLTPSVPKQHPAGP